MNVDEHPDLTDLHLRPLQADLLDRLHKRYSLIGKKVCEIGSDLRLSVAQAMRRYGASEVWAVNPNFSIYPHLPLEGVIIIPEPFENVSLPIGYFDIIFGMALLEHVANPTKLSQACKQTLHPYGICYLQGSPTWTGPQGHHIWIKGSTPQQTFLFNNESSPFDDWEHLTITSGQQLFHSLKKKAICDIYFSTLYQALFCDDSISRLSPSQITKRFSQVTDVEITDYYHNTNVHKNLFYEKAKKIYSEKDLLCNDITIIMHHKGITHG
jgi:SAM-dependent methyltransferase